MNGSLRVSNTGSVMARVVATAQSPSVTNDSPIQADPLPDGPPN
jgi:hypothetical protein